MTDDAFWSIADDYEQLNKDDQSYVPKNQAAALARDIAAANDYDYDETVADLNLFRWGKNLDDEVPSAAMKLAEKLCKKN